MSGVPYHAWTHRPKLEGGTDPIDMPGDPPWARLADGAGTVTHNTWVNVTCNTAMSYNEDTPGDIFTLDDQGDRFRLILAAEGIYLVHGIFTWDDTFPEFRAVDLMQGAGTGAYSERLGLTVTKGPFPSTTGSDAAHFGNVDCISAFIFNSSSTPDPTLDPRAFQFSGASRGCNGYSVRAIYLGDVGLEANWEYVTT